MIVMLLVILVAAVASISATRTAPVPCPTPVVCPVRCPARFQQRAHENAPVPVADSLREMKRKSISVSVKGFSMFNRLTDTTGEWIASESQSFQQWQIGNIVHLI